MNVSIVWAMICLAGTVLADSHLDKPFYDVENAENIFRDYVIEHKKSYNPKEHLERLGIFKESLKSINERNAKFPGTVFKVNHFADLTPEERAQYRGFKPLNATIQKVRIPDGPTAAPDTLDWREKAVVAHVKDQKTCGCSHVFSAIGNMEGQYALKHKQCLALSEGLGLECTVAGSCNGGLMHEVMNQLKWIWSRKEKDYHYKPKRRWCNANHAEPVTIVLKSAVLDIPDEEVLKKKLADIGPLAVALNADDLDDYHGGILKPDKCKGQGADHGAVLVGYGEENGEKFWIIKNSWGEGWGEQGYLRLQRGVNACDMGTTYTASATVR